MFSTMSSAILNARALELEWILIGCLCFIIQQLEKNCSESDPNYIVPLYRYSCDVDSILFFYIYLK